MVVTPLYLFNYFHRPLRFRLWQRICLVWRMSLLLSIVCRVYNN